MARFWTEPLDPSKHIDYMSSCNVGGLPVEAPHDRLIEQLVYFVRVCNFEFQFQSLNQLGEAIAFFKQKIRPSSLQPNVSWSITGNTGTNAYHSGCLRNQSEYVSSKLSLKHAISFL